MEELTDIYDENNRHIGHSTRSEAQRLGHWIRSFHCWIIDTESNAVIFQKRALSKKVHPNLFDISAAGHFQQGESIEDGVRELQEELGVVRTIDQLKFLGIRTEVAKLGSILVREFAYTYFLIDKMPITALLADQAEVSGITYVPIDEGLEVFGDTVKSIEVSTYSPEVSGWKMAADTFNALQVIPRKDLYYLKVFIMAERALSGAGGLAI